MALPKLSAAKQAKICQMAALGKSYREIGRALGINYATVGTYWPRDIAKGRTKPAAATAPTKPSESDEIAGDRRTLTLDGTPIHTLEELAAHCKIDLDTWQIERWICNKWEVGAKVGAPGKEEIKVTPLFQIKAWLIKRPGIDEANRIIERLRLKAEKYAPSYPPIRTAPAKSGNVVEISPVDVHHGAYIWGAETGGADYDLKISTRLYRDAVEAIIARTDSYKPESALIVFGHDQQNADNKAGSTEMLTPQSNDSRYQKVADASLDSTLWAIDLALKRYGKVEVKMVPGNHDALSTWHLGRVLAAWYRHVPQVTIDNSPCLRKYWEFGINMLLLMHGNKGKRENFDKTMAAEQPAMWGRTRWREAHVGHWHTRGLIETPGATVRTLPSLRPACAWTSEMLFNSIRAAEGFVWNHGEGLVGMATYSVMDKK